MINRNAERAQGLVAKDVDITSNQVPIPLNGHLALEKPRRFRMIVKAPLTHTTVAARLKTSASRAASTASDSFDIDFHCGIPIHGSRKCAVQRRLAG